MEVGTAEWGFFLPKSSDPGDRHSELWDCLQSFLGILLMCPLVLQPCGCSGWSLCKVQVTWPWFGTSLWAEERPSCRGGSGEPVKHAMAGSCSPAMCWGEWGAHRRWGKVLHSMAPCTSTSPPECSTTAFSRGLLSNTDTSSLWFRDQTKSSIWSSNQL